MATVPSPWLLAADLLDPPRSPYFDDPVEFARVELGLRPWSKQVEMLEAVRDHDRVAVRACHGVGKTFTCAAIVLWFLSTRPNSRVITTAPTFDPGVKALLWRAIRNMVATSHRAGRLADIPTPKQVEIDKGPEWFAAGYSTDEPERFSGHHARHLLFVVDEASGVDDRIFEAGEGFLTGTGAKVVMIGNPTRIGTQFHRAWTKERGIWKTIEIGVFDSPNFTGERVPADVAEALPQRAWQEEKLAQWGERSPMYEVRVLGRFPSSASNAVIPLLDVEEAQRRKLPAPTGPRKDLARIAVDVARFGDDETVICVKHGGHVRILEIVQGKDTVFVTARVAAHAGRYKVAEIVVDDDGVGGGVTDQLRAKGLTVHPFRGAGRPHEPDDYPNARSELWFTMADEIGDIDLDEDEQLAADLSAPTYKLDVRGRRVVEPKAETKKRLGRSPDRADAALMTLWTPPVMRVPDGAGGETEQAITAGLMDERW